MQTADANAYRWNYLADLVTVPIATSIAVFWLFSMHEVTGRVLASAVIVGFIFWTFAEYGMHRWGFHAGLFTAAHRFHHVNPTSYSGASPIMTAIFGALAFWFLTAVFGPVIGVGLLVGLVVGYLIFLLVHDSIHHHNTFEPGTYLALLAANHEYHHERNRVNFGVISPAWDIIFGTYQRAPR